jgi:hypothetical protein
MSPSRARPKRKPIALFAVQAAVLGLALLFLPGVRHVYPRVFNEHANLVFHWFGDHREVRFKTLPPGTRKDGSDSRMSGYGPGYSKAQWRLIYRIQSRGWWPTAMLIGMVLATPLALRRRLIALVGGVLLLDGTLLLRIAVTAETMFGASGPRPDALATRVLDPVIESFNSWVPPTVCVLLSWVVVARPSRTIDVRGGWVAGLLRRGARPADAPDPGEKPAQPVAEHGEQSREDE